MTIILILLLLVCSVILNVLDILYYTKYINLDDAYDSVETGDLICFRWKEVALEHEFISPFTHIGMVIVKTNPITNKLEKYIIETHLAGDTSDIGIYKGGINIYPLKLRINKYDGNIFLAKLDKSNRPRIENVNYFLSNTNKYKESLPFHDDYKGYFKNNCLKKRISTKLNCPKCFDIEEKNGLFCSEFVGFCLKELGILDSDFEHNCLVPGDFRFIKDSNNNILYKELLKIK